MKYNNDLSHCEYELLIFIDKRGYITKHRGESFCKDRGNFNRIINILIMKGYVQNIKKYDRKETDIYLITKRAFIYFKHDKKYWAERELNIFIV
jgi:hypothetical protein